MNKKLKDVAEHVLKQYQDINLNIQFLIDSGNYKENKKYGLNEAALKEQIEKSKTYLLVQCKTGIISATFCNQKQYTKNETMIDNAVMELSEAIKAERQKQIDAKIAEGVSAVPVKEVDEIAARKAKDEISKPE